MAKEKKRRLFSRFSLACTRLFSTSVFAWFVSLYARANARLKDGVFHDVHVKFSHQKGYLLRLKGLFARQVEDSFFSGLCKKIVRDLCTLRVKTLGVLFFVFGLCTCAVYLFDRLLPIYNGANSLHLVCGVTLFLASLPLLLQRTTLAKALAESRLIGSFLKHIALFRNAEFATAKTPHSQNALGALFGLILGILSIFLNPFLLLLYLLIACLAALSLYKPEFCTALLLFLLPFSSGENTALLTVFAILCLMLKVFRGRRTLRFELLSLSALFFSAFWLLSAVLSSGGGKRESFLFFFCSMAFFLISNLSPRREVYKVLLFCFVAGSSLSGGVRVLYSLLPEQLISGALRTFFRTLTENASMMFTVTALILALYFLLRAKSASVKLYSFICLALLLADLWLYSSVGGMLTAAVCCALLLATSSRALFFTLAVGALGVIIVLPLLQGEQLSFLWQALHSAPSALFEENLLGPQAFFIGLGSVSAESLASLGLSVGTASVPLYTRIFFTVGLFGALLLFFFLTFSFQKAAHYFFFASHNRDRLLATAPLLCAFAVLLLGFSQSLIADERIFFLLFSFTAISSSFADLLHEEDTALIQHF